VIQPLDMLFAFKALSLTDELSATDARVGAAVVDSYNKKTGQCDPSLGRIACLLNLSRRTVIRSVNKLVAHGFLRKIRHGGKYHRNQYYPCWARYREVVHSWSVRFKGPARRQDAHGNDLKRNGCHFAGDEVDTQTLPINRSITAAHSKSLRDTPLSASRARPSITWIPPGAAAESAAERRWNHDVHNQFASTPSVYGKVIEAITPELSAAATAAELRRRGDGLLYLLRELRKGGLQEWG